MLFFCAMTTSKGVILLDTFQLRQQTIIHYIKPKNTPYSTLFGVRWTEDPVWYKEKNTNLIVEYEQKLAHFLSQHPWSDVVSNYYFAILPQTWELVQKYRDRIGNIFVLTCQDDFYATHAQPNNYPINPRHIITYHDDYNRWQDDLRDALNRPY